MAKRKPTAWTIHLMKVYDTMKKKNPQIKLREVMPIAAKSYKK